MDENKEKIFLKYISDLIDEGKPYRSLGMHIYSVRKFLETDYPITRRGYKKYCATNAAELINQNFIKGCLCEFLNWKGIGFSTKKKKVENVKALEKISVVNERNQQMLNDFTEYMNQKTDLSPSTVNNYSRSVKLFFYYAPEFSLEMCKSYIATLEKEEKAPRTINLRINALCRFGEFLKKPVALKRLKYQKTLHTDNVPTMAEYTRLLEYLKEHNMVRYFDVKILATTGARFSEFVKMTWEDVLNGEVTLKGKGGKYRHFFYSKELVKEAKEYVKTTGIKGPILVGKQGVLSSTGFRSYLKVCGERIGIDKSKMHPHAFRHFFAKMYLKKNKDVVQLAELLGHSSIDTTKIYLQKSYEEQKRDFSRNVTW